MSAIPQSKWSARAALQPRLAHVLWLLCALALYGAAASSSAAYPEKPVRVIIPFAPGGGTDIVGRLIADQLANRTGSPFVPENRPGASAAIGANMVAKAPSDGYMLLLGTSAELTMVPQMNPATPYNPVADFVPIAMLGSTPNILLANLATPFKDLPDLIEHAKANPGKYSYASGGMGPYLSGELFKSMAGVAITNIPYQGTGPANNDLLGGHVQLMVSTVPAAVPFVKSGRVKALAVTSATRSSQLPEVPTMAEQGLKGYDATTWFGLFAPANTPSEVVDVLRTTVDRILDDKDVQRRLVDLGIEISTPAERHTARSRIEADLQKWGKLIKDTGIKQQ